MKKILFIIAEIVISLIFLFFLTGLIIGFSESIGLVIFCLIFEISSAFAFFKVLKKIKQLNKKIKNDEIKCTKNEPKKQTESKEQQTNNTKQQENNINIEKKEFSFPKKLIFEKVKDGANLAYRYDNQKVILLKTKLNELNNLKFNEKLSAVENQGKIVLLAKNNPIGILADEQKSDMVKDWINRNEPFSIFVKEVSTSPYKLLVFIAFYRNKREKLSYREKSSFKLTNYRDEESQMIICCLEKNEEIELVESCDFDGNDCVYAEVDCVEIGKLPKKIEKRYFDEGAHSCFFDYFDYDEEKDIYTPHVTIYW